MNDLIRPALYQAHHEIVPVQAASRQTRASWTSLAQCAKPATSSPATANSPLSQPGDLVALLDAGAYGMAQSSNYNSRPRAAEVLVEGSSSRLIRRRETIADLLAPEIPAARQ